MMRITIRLARDIETAVWYFLDAAIPGAAHVPARMDVRVACPERSVRKA